MNAGAFYDNGAYHIPESIENLATAKDAYDFAMMQAQDAYNCLIAKGIPPEDARNVIPLGVVSWAD